jgi:hypothetical protein
MRIVVSGQPSVRLEVSGENALALKVVSQPVQLRVSPLGPPGVPGAPGAPGADGSPGQPGQNGIMSVQTFTQVSPASVWTINHNLGRWPLIDLFSVGGVKIIGETSNLSLNTAQVTFDEPVAGSARYI